MDESGEDDLAERIKKFLRGPRCLSPGQPPTDELMEQWVDGRLSRDPLAADKIEAAIKFSTERVEKAGAIAERPGPAQDARNCYFKRADILRDILRSLRNG